MSRTPSELQRKNMQAFMDEAGFTGRNLLDPEQPILVHASICDLGTGSLCEIVDQASFPRGGQLKYSGLRGNHLEKIRGLVFNLIDSEHFHVSFGVANKLFGLAAVCIEYIVEEAFAKKELVADRNRLNYLAHWLFFEMYLDQKRNKGRLTSNLSDFFRPDRAIEKTDLQARLLRRSRKSCFHLLGRYLQDLDNEDLNRDTSLLISVSLIHNNVLNLCETFPSLSINILHDRAKFDESAKQNLKKLVTDQFSGNDAALLQRYRSAFGIQSFDFAPATDHLGIQVADLLSGFIRDVVEKKIQLSESEISKLPEPTSTLLPESNPADLPDLSYLNGNLDVFAHVRSKLKAFE